MQSTLYMKICYVQYIYTYEYTYYYIIYIHMIVTEYTCNVLYAHIFLPLVICSISIARVNLSSSLNDMESKLRTILGITIPHNSNGVLISLERERDDRDRRCIANCFLSTFHFIVVSRGGGSSPKNLINKIDSK